MKAMIRTMLCAAALLHSLSAFASGGEPAGYTETEDPIVLVHGIIGWDSILNSVPYWYGIESALEDDGATVYVANLPAMNNDTQRGEALISYLEQLKAQHGHQQFNIIAHSQGALTSRYAAGTRPDLVTSVSTMGGAHMGSSVADLAVKIESGLPSGLSVLVQAFVNGLAAIIDVSSGASPNESAMNTLQQFSAEGINQWLSDFGTGAPTTECGQGPEVAGGIHWYSMGGVAGRTSALDPFDLIADAGTAVLAFNGQLGDGVIQRCSTHWGKVIRDDYFLNHADLINHTLGLGVGSNLFTPNVPEIYRTHANRLKGAGL